MKGLVLFAHGLHEHALRFCNLARAFNTSGLAFYAIDHCSHGKSDGEPGLLSDYNILVKDFVKFAEIARSAHPPGTPTFIVCHSMGSLVVLLALKSIPDVSAAIFSGCALFSGPGASSLFGVKCLFPISQLSVAVSIAKVLASVSPRGDAAPILEDEITSDKDELQRIRRDPRMIRSSIRNRTAYELLKMVVECKAAVPEVARRRSGRALLIIYLFIIIIIIIY